MFAVAALLQLHPAAPSTSGAAESPAKDKLPAKDNRAKGTQPPASGAKDDPLGAAVQAWESKASGSGGASALDQNPFSAKSGAVTPANRIDEFVFERLKQKSITPADLCSDGVFVRRVYLDIIGTLPTADEARKFLEDKSPAKRSVLIDELLAKPEFADYWAMKWSDLLRVKSEFPINLWPNASQAYHRWLRASLRQNMPYDRFARELITASGSNFRTPQVNFYRALQNRDPQGVTKAVALIFMGSRAEKWPPERLAGTAVFFSKIGYKPTGEWKEEIVVFDPNKGKTPPAPAAPATPAKPPAASAKPSTTAASSAPAASAPAATGPPAAPPAPVVPLFPDGTPATIPADQDPRIVFADWLIRPENPWFSRQIVNRIWYWLLGRGIVHEPDDIRPGNSPQNPELLNWLAKELIDSKYDMKHIYRLILNSNTYQLSSVPKSQDPQAAANFACYPLRRLEAEVLIDAICQITGTTESYSSMIPEPYTFIPEDRRSIALPDGSITSPFLEMFGRPPRDTGLESERNNRMTAAQKLHLLNSSHIRQKIQQGPALRAILESGGDGAKTAEMLYLTILSRLPTDEEKYAVQEYCRSPGGGQTVAWALINTTEFLHRH
jgi:hypothetical protein